MSRSFLVSMLLLATTVLGARFSSFERDQHTLTQEEVQLEVQVLLNSQNQLMDTREVQSASTAWFRRKKGSLCNRTWDGSRSNISFMPNGTGSCKFDELGGNFTGLFVNGSVEGNGRIQFANGDVYLGEVERLKGKEGESTFGHMHGFGEYDFENGDHYEGNWEFSKRNGAGFLMYSTGDMYDGTWENDEPTSGTYTFDNGASYTGGFVDKLRDGRGKYTFKNGSVMEGDFVAGEIKGISTLTYPNGDKLTSKFEYGLPVGKGIYVRANGQQWNTKDGNLLSRNK